MNTSSPTAIVLLRCALFLSKEVVQEAQSVFQGSFVELNALQSVDPG